MLQIIRTIKRKLSTQYNNGQKCLGWKYGTIYLPPGSDTRKIIRHKKLQLKIMNGVPMFLIKLALVCVYINIYIHITLLACVCVYIYIYIYI